MLPITSTIISLLFLFSNKGRPLNDFFNQDITPPGTVWVKDNFYVDRNELSNIDYREYQYWTAQVFGKTSPEYVATLLDSTVIKDKLNLGDGYFNNPIFDNHPIIGISWEQALDYSKWRTDRVCEMVLIQAGVLEINPSQSKKDYFTYRRYLNGEYLDYEPVEELEVPIYGLPTKKEWEEIIYPAAMMDEKKKKSAHIKKEKTPMGPRARKYKKSKKDSINNLLGNVSEMVSEKGISKGGSWKHSLEECNEKNEIKYSKPNNWLGFRNTCKTVVLKRTNK